MHRWSVKDSDIGTTVRMLRRHAGRRWPVILLCSLVSARSLVRGTRWAAEGTAEARFVRRMALAPAIYLELKERLGADKALAAVRESITAIGLREVTGTLRSLPVVPPDPMDHLQAFYRVANQEPPNVFMARTTTRQTADCFRFRITRCLFHEFFTAVGTPELTQLFCAIDEEFFPRAFPQLAFHRDLTLNNTIGRGNAACQFAFDRKASGNAAT
jgi:L-2-amino-thiazoline-4-carboxylic acid hydrolase